MTDPSRKNSYRRRSTRNPFKESRYDSEYVEFARTRPKRRPMNDENPFFNEDLTPLIIKHCLYCGKYSENICLPCKFLFCSIECSLENYELHARNCLTGHRNSNISNRNVNVAGERGGDNGKKSNRNSISDDDFKPVPINCNASWVDAREVKYGNDFESVSARQFDSDKSETGSVGHGGGPICLFKKDSYTKVVVSSAESDSSFYVVLDSDDMFSKMEEFHYLLEKAQNKLCLMKAAVNKRCLTLYENIWCRGIIVSVDPICVFLVDFGHTLIRDQENIKMFPSEFDAYPPFGGEVSNPRVENRIESFARAQKVRSSKPIPGLTASQILKIKLLSESNGECLVEVEDNPIQVVPQQNIAVNADVAKNNSYIAKSPFRMTSVDEVVISFIESKNTFYVRLMSEYEQHQSITDNLNNKEKLSEVNPELNKMVVAYYKGWWRAIVTNMNPIKVYFVDFGNEEICTLNQIKKLPEEFYAVPYLAHKIVTEELHDIEEEQKIWIRLTAKGFKEGINYAKVIFF